MVWHKVDKVLHLQVALNKTWIKYHKNVNFSDTECPHQMVEDTATVVTRRHFLRL